MPGTGEEAPRARLPWVGGRVRPSPGAGRQLARTEGILPALESSHAIAALPRVAAELDDGAVMLVSLSGRGDKDMGTIAKALGVELPR